jgi:hypothetical protein
MHAVRAGGMKNLGSVKIFQKMSTMANLAKTYAKNAIQMLSSKEYPLHTQRKQQQ